jgi:hypothetical protein
VPTGIAQIGSCSIGNELEQFLKYLQMHLSIPESEARCSNCGKEPSSEDEWIIGTVETSFCKIFMAISLRLSYGPACIVKE